MRFIKVFGLVAVLAGVLAATGAAGGFTDASYITPVGYTFKPYSHTVQWKPGTGCPPFKFSIASGAFPPGLVLSSDGHITGTPTQAGVFTFYIEMRDACNDDQQGNSSFTIRIQPGVRVDAPPLLPAAVTGVAFTYAFPVSGGGPFAWSLSAGALPDGLTLSPDGVLSGTPTTVKNYNFTVQVSNPNVSDTKNVTVEVFAPLKAPAIRGAELGVPFTSKLTETGGTTPYAWSATGLPDGLTIDAAQGVISGTPTTTGSFSAAVTVTDKSGLTNQVTVPLTVNAELAIATAGLRGAKVGSAYHGKIRVTGGLAPDRFAVISGKLPTGIHLNARTGALTGRPTTAGTFHFRVRARDALGGVATRALVLSVH